jgi:putative transposase
VAKLHRPGDVEFSRLPKGVQHAGASRIERKQLRGSVTDLLFVSEKDWKAARWHASGMEGLIENKGPLGPRIKRLANLFSVTPRTVERWLQLYRRNPDAIMLLPRSRGPTLGRRRLSVSTEKILGEVIDLWTQRTEPLPISWIVEECASRCKSANARAPSRRCVEERLRDRGIESLRHGFRAAIPTPPERRPPRSNRPLAIVQMDHTLVDIMVVDEVHRQPMGRPWVTIAFDIATRVVLGFVLSLHPPSSVSVGLALAMAGLPKDQWLQDREIKIQWPMFGLPKILHLDNGAEFHSLALARGCERYGISVEYRPPGRPHFGGHIERYLGTLMRRIHGLPGTTMSSPAERGNYPSEAKAAMSLAELEKWIALEIAGRYHLNVHRGLHAIPSEVWARTRQPKAVPLIDDAARFVIDFLPAEMRRVRRDGFQLNRIRYWDPVLSSVFPVGTQMLVRFDPRDLSRVFIPSPDQSEYLTIPYADLRRPAITLAELEKARGILIEKGDRQPTEDQIFATTAAQRQLEDASVRRSRQARRQTARRPSGNKKRASKGPPATPADYSKEPVPYGGEEW